MAELRYIDESPTGERLAEGCLSLDLQGATLASLLSARIDADLARLRDGELVIGLVQPMSVVAADALSDESDELVESITLSTPADIEPGALVEIASAALRDGLLEVMVDGRALSRLDAPLLDEPPASATDVIFIKRAPLLGG